MTQQGTSSGQGHCPPLCCSYLPRRISAGSRHPSIAPAMAGTDLLIDIVRAVAKGNQELFQRALEALITEGDPSSTMCSLICSWKYVPSGS